MEQHRRIIDRGIERNYMCACVYRFICSCEGLKPSCENIKSGLHYLKGSQISQFTFYFKCNNGNKFVWGLFCILNESKNKQTVPLIKKRKNILCYESTLNTSSQKCTLGIHVCFIWFVKNSSGVISIAKKKKKNIQCTHLSHYFQWFKKNVNYFYV